jgi:tetratricopeptide (TPR) repeat protein
MQAYYSRGSARDSNGEYQLAIGDFDTVLQHDPVNYGAYVNRCWSRAVLGNDAGEAMDDCNRALQLSAAAGEALDARAFLELKTGKFGDAVSDYGLALQKDPNRASALFGRAVAELRMGDSAKAQDDLAAAEMIEPGIANRFARYGLTP